MEAIQYWIELHPEFLQSRFPKEFILESLRFILQNNYMHFNGNIYKQKLGTAMGTIKVAPTYATLVLGYLEKKLYDTVNEKYGDQFKTYLTNSWKRYLDDCFIIWEESEEKLNEFYDIFNNLHPQINFTMEYNRKQLSFLDVLIMKNGNNIVTDIYNKNTDTTQYLLYSSCHPKHTKDNIPYNLARRICTIVSDQNTRYMRLCELKKLLQERNYPILLIEHGIRQAMSHERKDLLRIKPKENKTVIPYVSTHNPKIRKCLILFEKIFHF